MSEPMAAEPMAAAEQLISILDIIRSKLHIISHSNCTELRYTCCYVWAVLVLVGVHGTCTCAVT